MRADLFIQRAQATSTRNHSRRSTPWLESWPSALEHELSEIVNATEMLTLLSIEIHQEAYNLIRQVKHQSRYHDFDMYSNIIGHGKLRDATQALLYEAETGFEEDDLDSIITKVTALRAELNFGLYGRP